MRRFLEFLYFARMGVALGKAWRLSGLTIKPTAPRIPPWAKH